MPFSGEKRKFMGSKINLVFKLIYELKNGLRQIFKGGSTVILKCIKSNNPINPINPNHP
jgi:hypothetical protein